MIIKILILFVLTGLLPLGLGLVPTGLMQEEHRSFAMAWITGWMFMFGIFQAVAVPLIVFEAGFGLCSIVYTAIILLTGAMGLFIGRKTLICCVRRLMEKLPDREYLMLMIPVVILIIIQIVMCVVLFYPDGDDAFYIGTSATALHTDSMYIYSPYTGDHGPLDMRHALSPVPIFMAWLSRCTRIPVAMLCHSCISWIFLILMYAIYHEIGAALFPRQRKNLWIFMIFINIRYLFGNVSIYMPESFAYTRTWQGKSILPNIIIPLLFLILIYMAKDEMEQGEMLLMFMTVMSAVFTTSTAIFSIPILMVGGVAILAFVKKKPVLTAQVISCLAPCALYGLIYLIKR